MANKSNAVEDNEWVTWLLKSIVLAFAGFSATFLHTQSRELQELTLRFTELSVEIKSMANTVSLQTGQMAKDVEELKERVTNLEHLRR